MKRSLVLMSAALACASCARKEKDAEAYSVAITAPRTSAEAVVSHAVDAAAAPADAPPAPPAEPPDGAAGLRLSAAAPMLAYSYSYGLALPHRRVDALRRRHEQACVEAGYQVCQVVSTSISDQGDGDVHADLAMRATPGWLRTFRAGLEGEAKGAGGRIETSDVTSEDLSREIVDTEAQLRAKTTLRDRLQGLLAGRPGRLADLLSVERELARVQGEIDSARSQLTVMRARVAMSQIEVGYASNDVVGPAVRSPLGASVSGVFGIMAANLAQMITLLAAATPWLVALAVSAWVFRKRLPKLRRRSTETAQAPAG